MDTAEASSRDINEPILFTYLQQQQTHTLITTLLTELRTAQHSPASPTPAAAASVGTPLPLSLHHTRLGGSAAFPERYGGDPAGCRTFLLAVELYMADFPELTS